MEIIFEKDGNFVEITTELFFVGFIGVEENEEIVVEESLSLFAFGNLFGIIFRCVA